MIIGENSRDEDMDVNITKEKKQTNIRSSTSDNFEKLIPPRKLSLEQSPRVLPRGRVRRGHAENVRIRKVILDAERARAFEASRTQGLTPRR